MNRKFTKSSGSGFSLVELLAALGIFLIICAAAFTLLGTSQKRYQSDSQVLSSFQEARLGMDQMVRDINDAGFPPPNYFATQNSSNQTQFAAMPFPWNPSGAACQIGSTCVIPGDFDLIIETNPDPVASNQVSWIRYRLGLPNDPNPNPTTLYRGMSRVVLNGDPSTDNGLLQAMTPYVQNVMNNPPTSTPADPNLFSDLQAAYPALYPGAKPAPIFSYVCDTGTGPQSCTSPLSDHSPTNIRDVVINLIVMAPVPDAQSGRPRLVQLNGRGRRMNPSQ